MIKVAHLTSAHPDNDVRIFHKECASLADAGYDVFEVTLNGTERIEKGVKIISANFVPTSRFNRMKNAAKQILIKAKEVDADVYHFHDPELLKVGLKLRKMGKTVIYDAHEDTPRQILAKPYLNKPVRRIISFFYEKYENYAAKRMSAIVTATPFIRERYLKLNPQSIEICNFPLFSEIEGTDLEPISFDKQEKKVCYIGGISRIRGIEEMILAAGKSNVELDIAGKWPEGLQDEMKSLEGWEKTNNLGFLSREDLLTVKRESLAGLVALYPEPNHLNSYPIKMFEYMAAGIPIIASDFPLWRSIVEAEQCGLCVNPQDPDEISKAIDFLIANPEKAKEMGENGRKAIIEKYNWDIEKKKLSHLYETLTKTKN